MNRFTVKAILVAICLLLPCMAYALPGPHDPMTSGNAIMCESCHTGTATPLNALNNVCLTCHNGTSTTGPTGVGGRIIQPFTLLDYADPYNAGDVRVDPFQTSHKWAGTDTQPKAGALPPTDPYQTTTKGMNKRGLTGSVTCVRCHSIHGNSGTSSESFPYLRSPNNNDQMCLDCHRSRNHSDQAFGTHPVNVDLAAAAALKPASYNSTPTNTNPANPTTALNLIGGKVQCSTCHGMHYVDGKSGTTHNAANFNKLSTSRGGLIRTNLFGKTSSDLNVCTSCHKSSNHDVGGQNIQCNDCHTGHVDYVSPADIALNPKEATPNTFMLRRYVNYSSDASGKNTVKLNTYRKKMVYWNTSGWANSQKTGVCQACHKLPGSEPKHSDPTYLNDATKCVECHTGGTHSVVPPAGCDGCHGSPPQHNVAGTGKTGGYAVDAAKGLSYASVTPTNIYKNESTAGHPTHAASKPYSYSCDQCHKGNRVIAGQHDDNAGGNIAAKFQYVFVDKAGITAGASATFVGGTTSSTCSNMFCHSYGTAALTGAKTVLWQANMRGTYAVNPNRCILCHNGVDTGVAFNNLSTNSHFRHVDKGGKNIGCKVCHSSTVSDNKTVSSTTNHANGARDLAIDSTFIAGNKLAGSTLTAASCTTYCHTDGKGSAPVTPLNWTSRASGKCDSCHKTATNTYGFGIMTSNAHFTHISSSYGPKRNTNALCNNCHNYTAELATTHVDGTVSMNLIPAQLCLNCHAQSTPTWQSSTRVTCESCHSGRGSGTTDTFANRSWATYDASGTIRAPFKAFSTFTNRGHGQAGFSVYCRNCHNDKSQHLNGATSAAGTYKGSRIFGNLSGMSIAYSADKLCIDCHNDGANGGRGVVTDPNRINMKSHVKDRTPTYSYCISCHDTHGTANKMGIKTVFNVMTGNGRGASVKTVVFTNITSGFVNATRTGLCQVCHTNTTAYRNYTSRTGIYVGTVAYKGSWGHMGGNKKCLSCHKHTSTAAYAFEPTGGGACNGCHGYPPNLADGMSNPVASSNTHLSHNMASKNVSDDLTGSATGMACTTCHNVTAGTHPVTGAGTTISIGNSLKFNSGNAFTYSGTYQCSNASCHFKASPAWK